MTSVYALRARQLFVVFCAWKALLLSVAAFSPGPGYDTSALILVDASNRRHANHLTSSRPSRLGLNLFRWDALYFVKAAERGIVYEQEWAFSPTYSRLLYFACQFFSGRSDCSMRCYVVAGIVISNICHFLSVLVLYRLLTIVLGRQQQRQIPFVASILHILTPASLFLSAPYAEAMFSLLNLGGMLLYAQSRAPGDNRPSIWEDAYKLCAGLLFGLATMVRSNGLLSGLILLYDVARYSPQLISMRLSVHDLRRIIVTCVSGTFVAAGFVLPQILAYTKFCNQDVSLEARPWCEKSIPSIYSWVQSHYWNVGLFRYWTLSNLPLFMLALPMLWVLLGSSVTTLHNAYRQSLHGRSVPPTSDAKGLNNMQAVACDLPELALPQLVLAIAAATSFHVQIVNRIASGYPMWYMTIATWLVDQKTPKDTNLSQWAVRGMVMYSLIQGALFANFLPPA